MKIVDRVSTPQQFVFLDCAAVEPVTRSGAGMLLGGGDGSRRCCEMRRSLDRGSSSILLAIVFE
jgi:hypothetical protein